MLFWKMPFSSEKPKYKRLWETLNFLAIDTTSQFTVARALTDILSPVLFSHGSWSSALRSDLLKVANSLQTPHGFKIQISKIEILGNLWSLIFSLTTQSFWRETQAYKRKNVPLEHFEFRQARFHVDILGLTWRHKNWKI